MRPLFEENTNMLYASVLVETLSRLGCKYAVIAPGSRNAPLTLAFAAHKEIEAIPVVDERSAAFFALGLSKKAKQATALVCTSGSAGAHFYPAILEAKQWGVPLLVITADRPPKLHDCSERQTVDQKNLYADHCNFKHSLGLPEANIKSLSYLRQTMLHAWRHTQWPSKGPAHINLPMQEPLYPEIDHKAKNWSQKQDWDAFFSHISAFTHGETQLKQEIPKSFKKPKGIIVLGSVCPEDEDSFSSLIYQLSESLGWPILAEALSPLRYRGNGQSIISRYDTILRDKNNQNVLKPEVVLHIGRMPTSKTLLNWLDSFNADTFTLSESVTNLDPLHRNTTHLHGSLASLTDKIQVNRPDLSYQKKWNELEAKINKAFDIQLEKEEQLFEGKIPWMLTQYLPCKTPIFISNSMPVRDMEFFAKKSNNAYQIYFNKGLSGIDGITSTALGIAYNSAPTVLITGDLSFFHDTNALLLHKHFKGSLTIIIINNDGGGIFKNLPISETKEYFEKYIATPQSVNIAKLLEAYKIKHQEIKNWKVLQKEIESLPQSGIQVLEIKTNSDNDIAYRKNIFNQVFK